MVSLFIHLFVNPIFISHQKIVSEIKTTILHKCHWFGLCIYSLMCLYSIHQCYYLTRVPRKSNLTKRFTLIFVCSFHFSNWCQFIRPPIDRFKTLQFYSFDDIYQCGLHHGFTGYKLLQLGTSMMIMSMMMISANTDQLMIN